MVTFIKYSSLNKMEKWIGKVALVTGGSVGIGAEISLALANCGMLVVAIARRYDLIEELAKKIDGNGKIYAKKCDVSNEEDVINMITWVKEQFGGIDVLINNAGFMQAEFIIDGKTDDFKKMFDVNVIASLIFLRETINDMRKRNVKGHIIVLNSILGHRIPDLPVPLFGVYPATKYSLTALSQTIRQELNFHKTSIKLTSISPGLVNTDFLKTFNSKLHEDLPKLNTDDVCMAVLYALQTPEHVQIEEIIMTAVLP